jgi:hypothetical protein
VLNIYRRKNVLSVGAGMLGMFILRPQFWALLITALIPYLLSLKWKKNSLRIFTGFYVIAIILFFVTGISTVVIEKQRQFSALHGTRFQMKKLEPGIQSFVETFPKAVNHVFLRPYPWEAKNVLQLFYSLEMIFFWLFVLFAALRAHPQWKQRVTHPIILMFIFFSLSLYILTGYIVPFPGAIVRYKIIAELVLLCVATILIKENANVSVLSKKPEFKR